MFSSYIVLGNQPLVMTMTSLDFGKKQQQQKKTALFKNSS